MKYLKSKRAEKKQSSNKISALEVTQESCVTYISQHLVNLSQLNLFRHEVVVTIVFDINYVNTVCFKVFVVGAIAKLGATVTTYPLLVVKVNIIIQTII